VSELQKTNEKIALIEKNNTEMQKKIERLEQLITSADSNNEKLNTAGK
jgi:cell division protein ZapA (FtsZ GTPase activity inhibitor)